MNVNNERGLARRFFMEHTQPALQLSPIPRTYYDKVNTLKIKQPGVYQQFMYLVCSIPEDLMAKARKGELTIEQLEAVVLRR